MRKSTQARATAETRINLTLNLDGAGQAEISSGVPFFDHMLNALCRFGMLDLQLRCEGDIAVDEHHTIEDVGICMGQAIAEALGDKRGIRRCGSCYYPMDEVLAFAAIDISGRGFLRFNAEFPQETCGGMHAQLAEEFFRALAIQAGITLHIRAEYGRNSHHMLEAMFKAFGRALDDAKQLDSRVKGVPSTKGVL